MIFILDAYNVIHKIKTLDAALDRGLRAGRDALIRFCSEVIERRGNISKIILVFDGKTEFHGISDILPPKIETIFSDTGEDADERIITVLGELEKTFDKCVVSDDNFVRNTARSHRAKGMSVAEFEAFCRVKNATAQKPFSERPSLDAAAADEITEEYKRKLGLN